MWLKACFLFFFGGVFFLLGIVFTLPTIHFVLASEPATLIVLRVEQDIHHSGTFYRPVFGRYEATAPRFEHAGIVWSGEQLHTVGDIFEGRHDAETGVMLSNAQWRDNLKMGLILLSVGLFVMLLPVIAPGVVRRMRWSNGRRSHDWR